MARVISTAVLLVALTAIACYYDIKHGVIPNRITLPFFLGGLVLNGLAGGLGGLGLGLAGGVMGISLLLIPFLLHMVGGGDVKFLGAVGALLGYRLLWWGFLLGAVLGGVLGLVKIIAGEGEVGFRHPLHPLWLVWDRLVQALTEKPAERCGFKELKEGNQLPYALPLSFGIVICFFISIIQKTV